LKVRANPEKWKYYKPLPPPPVFETPEEIEEEDRPPAIKNLDKLKGHWDLRLTGFQKLIFVKTFEEEKVCYTSTEIAIVLQSTK